MFLEIGRIICDPDGVVFYFHTDFAIIIGILRILGITINLDYALEIYQC